MKFQGLLLVLCGLLIAAADNELKPLYEVRVERSKGGAKKDNGEMVRILYGGEEVESCAIGLLNQSKYFVDSINTFNGQTKSDKQMHSLAPGYTPDQVQKMVVGLLDGCESSYQIKMLFDALRHNYDKKDSVHFVKSIGLDDLYWLQYKTGFFQVDEVCAACTESLAAQIGSLDISKIMNFALVEKVSEKVDMTELQKAIIAKLPYIVIDKKELYPKNVWTPGLQSAVFTLDGTHLIIGTKREIFLMDTASKEVQSIPLEGYDIDIIYNPNRSNFLVRTNEGVVYVDLEHKIQKKIVSFGLDEQIGYCYAPDGKTFLIDSQQKILVCDAHTGERIVMPKPQDKEKFSGAGYIGRRVVMGIKDSNHDLKRVISVDVDDPAHRQEWKLNADEQIQTQPQPLSPATRLIGTTKRIIRLDMPNGIFQDIPFASNNLSFLSLHPDHKHILITLHDQLMVMRIDDRFLAQIHLNMHEDELLLRAYYMQNGNRLCIITGQIGMKARCIIMELQNDMKFKVIEEHAVNGHMWDHHFTDKLHVMYSGDNVMVIDRIKGVCQRLSLCDEEIQKHYIKDENIFLCTDKRTLMRQDDGSYIQLCNYPSDGVKSCDVHEFQFLVATSTAIRIKEICTKSQLNPLGLNEKQFLHKALVNWQQSAPHTITNYDELNCYRGLPRAIQKPDFFTVDTSALEHEARQTACVSTLKKMRKGLELGC